MTRRKMMSRSDIERELDKMTSEEKISVLRAIIDGVDPPSLILNKYNPLTIHVATMESAIRLFESVTAGYLLFACDPSVPPEVILDDVIEHSRRDILKVVRRTRG
jgi:hypothetical protein